MFTLNKAKTNAFLHVEVEKLLRGFVGLNYQKSKADTENSELSNP